MCQKVLTFWEVLRMAALPSRYVPTQGMSFLRSGLLKVKETYMASGETSRSIVSGLVAPASSSWTISTLVFGMGMSWGGGWKSGGKFE